MLLAVVGTRSGTRAVWAEETGKAAADATAADAMGFRGAVVWTRRRSHESGAVIATKPRSAEALAGKAYAIGVAHPGARDPLVAVDATVPGVTEAAPTRAEALAGAIIRAR